MLIAKAEIDALKRRHELAAFVASSGVQLRRVGKYLMGRCPFHDDSKESLVVDPKKQLWNCLGGCRGNAPGGPGKGSSGGDLFAFAMKAWGVDFREAYVRLGGEVTNELPPPRRRGGGTASGRANGGGELAPGGRAPRTEVLTGAVDHWHRQLSESREAQEYLESRGLVTRALWRAFRLGYSSGSLLEVVSEDSPARQQLHGLGILSRDEDGRLSERMAGRVVFPLFAFNQLPVNVYGRAISADVEPRHMYLPGPLRGLFNWNAARRAERIVLVESTIDALSLVEAGVGEAIALFGAHGVTEEHRELVRRFGVRRVVVALDADATGREAGAQVAERFDGLGAEVEVVEWPEEDPNALLVRHGPQKLRELVAALLAPAKPRSASNGAQDTAGEGDGAHGGEGESPAVSGASPSLIALRPLAAAVPAALASGNGSNGDGGAVKERSQAGPAALPAPRPARTELLGDALELVRDGRQWRVVWLPGASSAHVRATVRLRLPSGSFLDGLDLVSAKARESYAKRAARVLVAVSGTAGEQAMADLMRQLEGDLVALAELGEERRALLERGDTAAAAMPDELREEALALLRSPDLLAKVAAAIAAVGYVGEDANKLLGYLVGISRKLERPMSMVILSPSGSGKSGLADAIEALTPEEDFVSLSSLTPQALYYMPRDKLRRKLLLIEERAGSAEADFSIRALQSKQKLSRAVPIKDPATGKIETKVFEIFGPAAFLETTTESAIHPENATRCFEIHLDESEEQTRRIQEAQRRRKTLAGRWERPAREATIRLQHAAQRLLRPVGVVVLFAEVLEFPTAWLRTRRDNERFLNLIEAIAFLHQHQRPLLRAEDGSSDGRQLEEVPDEELAEVIVAATLEDYEHAFTLAGGLLGETLQDLKKPERAFLEAVRRYVEERGGNVGFSRREIREAMGLPQHRVRELFEALLELEYAEPVGAGRGAGVRYRLVSTPAQPATLPGLLEPAELRERLIARGGEWAELAKAASNSEIAEPTGDESNWRIGGESLEPQNHRHRRTVGSRR